MLRLCYNKYFNPFTKSRRYKNIDKEVTSISVFISSTPCQVWSKCVMPRVLNSMRCLGALTLVLCSSMTYAEPGHHPIMPKGVRYAGPIVYSNEKPPIIHFPPPPKGASLSSGWGQGPSQIKYIPMPHHDLPVLIYQSASNPPIHVVSPPRGSQGFSSSQSYGSQQSDHHGPQQGEYGTPPPQDQHGHSSDKFEQKVEHNAGSSSYGAQSSAQVSSSYGPPSSNYGPPSFSSGQPLSSAHGPGESFPRPQQSSHGPRPEGPYGPPQKSYNGHGSSHASDDGWMPGPPPASFSSGGGYGPPPPHRQRSPPPRPPPRNKSPAPHIVYTGHPPIHVIHQGRQTPQAPWSWGPQSGSSSSSSSSYGSESHGGHGESYGNSLFNDYPLEDAKNYGLPPPSSFHNQHGGGSSGGNRGSKMISFSYGPPKGSLSSIYEGNSLYEAPNSNSHSSSSHGGQQNEPQPGPVYGPPPSNGGNNNGPSSSYGQQQQQQHASLSSMYGSASENVQSYKRAPIRDYNFGGHASGHVSHSYGRQQSHQNGFYRPQPPKNRFMNSMISFAAPRIAHGPPKHRSKFALAPKAWHKPPIIIYAGVKPPVHVYKKHDGGYGESTSANSFASSHHGGDGYAESSVHAPSVAIPPLKSNVANAIHNIVSANNIVNSDISGVRNSNIIFDNGPNNNNQQQSQYIDNLEVSYKSGSSSDDGEIFLPSASAPRPTIIRLQEPRSALKTIYVSGLTTAGSGGPFKTYLVTNSNPVQIQHIGYSTPRGGGFGGDGGLTISNPNDMDSSASQYLFSSQLQNQPTSSSLSSNIQKATIIHEHADHIAESRILPSNPNNIFQNYKEVQAKSIDDNVGAETVGVENGPTVDVPLSMIVSTESTEYVGNAVKEQQSSTEPIEHQEVSVSSTITTDAST